MKPAVGQVARRCANCAYDKVDQLTTLALGTDVALSCVFNGAMVSPMRVEMKQNWKQAGILTRIVCAIALLFVGLLHKPPSVSASVFTPAELAVYTLPDGTVPVLCLPSEDGASKKHSHDFGSGCEACRLASAILLPEPLRIDSAIASSEADRFAPVRYEAFYRQLFPPNASPRAPPFGLIA